MLKPFKTEHYLFGIILLVNVVLRFFDFSQWSLSNDELSALFRLRFDTFSALIHEGVKIDGHPAFTQVFLYLWTKIFGMSVFAIRLPFVIAGIAGSVYFYLFIKEFVNKNAALLSFTALTCSQLFVLYSQIARPYAIGFLFTMGFAYYWFRLIQEPNKKTNWLGFVLFGFFGIISHYFASMSIALLLLFGLVFLNKKNVKAYFISGFSISILFLSHLNITLYQLKIGGVSWLPAPTDTFIYQFFKFVANGDLRVEYFVLLFPFIALISKSFHFKLWRIYLLPLLFFIPYAIAYYYSIHKSPLMQFSVLIFFTPFLIAFFFSFFSSNSNPKVISLAVAAILIVGIYSLVFERDFYQKRAFADFKGVANSVSEWTKEKGLENTLLFSNSNNHEYLNYYYKLDGFQAKFDIQKFENPKNIIEARDLIKQSTKDYAIVSFANFPAPAEVYELVKQVYPETIARHKSFNSDASLFYKSSKARDTLFHVIPEMNLKWNVNWEMIDTNNLFEKSPSHHVAANAEYALTYVDSVGHIFKNGINHATISGFIKSPENITSSLVMSIERNGENLYWRNAELTDFRTNEGWNQFITVFAKPQDVEANDLVKIYLWNPKQSDFNVAKFNICTFGDSDYNYYDL